MFLTAGHDPIGDWLIAFMVMTLDWLLRPEALCVGRLAIAEGDKFPALQHVFSETAAGPVHEVLASRLRHWSEERVLACDDPARDAVLLMDMAVAGMVSRTLYRLATYSGDYRRRQVVSATDVFLRGRPSTGR